MKISNGCASNTVASAAHVALATATAAAQVALANGADSSSNSADSYNGMQLQHRQHVQLLTAQQQQVQHWQLYSNS
jgi:hypothetical protein